MPISWYSVHLDFLSHFFRVIQASRIATCSASSLTNSLAIAATSASFSLR